MFSCRAGADSRDDRERGLLPAVSHVGVNMFATLIVFFFFFFFFLFFVDSFFTRRVRDYP